MKKDDALMCLILLNISFSYLVNHIEIFNVRVYFAGSSLGSNRLLQLHSSSTV